MLAMNLQFFAEGEEEDFDLDSFQQEFEESWKDDEDQEQPTEDEAEVEMDAETEEEEPEDEGDSEPKEEEEKPKFENEDQNRAFADMRRQLEESKKHTEFLQKLAEQNGMKPDELMEAFEKRKLEKEAQEKGVPVDMLQRLNKLEEENQQIRKDSWAKEFDSQVNDTIKKYELSEEDLNKVFRYMGENGIDPERTPIKFEDAYFLANKDTIIKTEREKARQTYLEDKKKRQETSAVPSGTSDSPNTDEITDDYVDEMLKKFDIRI